ncbi:RHS repeat domain-containing protein [Sulfobacillus thermosulfidooxidans]|uniref:RHS repeat domain-containing protein n=1 Tax=Sulfobacillus thermosulfidooxidans TaxID=28034 RepID=UPI000AB7EDDE|nr:RHS repeat protein [Sulfobacillus thermosulfidooxidans]
MALGTAHVLSTHVTAAPPRSLKTLLHKLFLRQGGNGLTLTQDGPKRTTQYKYNANGAIIQATTSLGNDERQTTQLQYNSAGDLVKVVASKRPSTEFTYSTMGNLIRATSGRYTTTFQYNGLGWLTGQSTGSGSSNSWQLLRVPMGTVVPTVSAQSSSGFVDYALGATRLTATQNHKTLGWTSLPDGSVLSTVNPGGELGPLQTYDAFGMFQTPTGAPIPLTYGYGGYSQYNVGGAEGIVIDHVGSRFYLPELGQYLSPDGQFVSPSYSYAGNAPTVLTDPSGHEGIPGAIIGAGLGLASGLLTAFVVPNNMSIGQKVGTVLVDTFGGGVSGVFGGEIGSVSLDLGQVGNILASSGITFSTSLVGQLAGGQGYSVNSVGTDFIYSFGFGGLSGFLAKGLTQLGAEQNMASYASNIFIGHYSLAAVPWMLPVSSWLHDMTTTIPTILGFKQGG